MHKNFDGEEKTRGKGEEDSHTIRVREDREIKGEEVTKKILKKVRIIQGDKRDHMLCSSKKREQLSTIAMEEDISPSLLQRGE